MGANWINWLFEHKWAMEIAAALLFLLFLNYFIKRVLSRSRKEKHSWKASIDYIFLSPMRVILWGLLFFFLIDLVARENEIEGILSYLGSTRNVLIVICLAWALLRWKKTFQAAMHGKKSKGGSHIDPISISILGKVFTALVIFVSSLIILDLWGLDVVPLMTFGGIGAAAIGIAGKDVLANCFGGMMIYMTRPFTIGDLIELPQKGFLGQVEEIGWYFTLLRNLQKKPIYIPNALFSTEIVVNFSQMTHRRIEEEIQIRFSDIGKIPKVIEEVKERLMKNIDIDQEEPIHVYLRTFGPYSANLDLQVYTITTRYDEFMAVKQRILLDVFALLAKEGVEMPYPTMTIEELKN